MAQRKKRIERNYVKDQRLVEAQRIKDIAKYTYNRGVLLNATFRSSYRSTRNIQYFSVNDIPLSILKWGTRYYLYSIKNVKPESKR